MSKWVRLAGGIVAEIFDSEPDFTAEIMATIRDDAPDDVSQGWISDGQAYAAPVPPPVTEVDYVAAVQGLLDATAQQRRYDTIMSACTYADSTNATFKAEGQACVTWRDAVWAQCYADLAAVEAGQMTRPSVLDFVASLPKLTWPS